jgi:hypothetical protein
VPEFAASRAITESVSQTHASRPKQLKGRFHSTEESIPLEQRSSMEVSCTTPDALTMGAGVNRIAVNAQALSVSQHVLGKISVGVHTVGCALHP